MLLPEGEMGGGLGQGLDTMCGGGTCPRQVLVS